MTAKEGRKRRERVSRRENKAVGSRIVGELRFAGWRKVKQETPPGPGVENKRRHVDLKQRIGRQLNVGYPLLYLL